MNANASNNNNGMRGAVLVCTDAPMPGYVYAAKVAAARAAADPFTNYDAVALTGTAEVPVLLPSPMAVANFSDANQNTAILDGLTPIAVQAGSLVIVFARTTLSTSDKALWDWSWIDQADDHRRDFRSQAVPVFKGCALISPGTTPRSRKDIDPQAAKSFAQAMLRRWESQGTYDGADANQSKCDAAINSNNRARIDIVYPESPKIPLHQVGVVALNSPPPIA
jgi:phage tail sheath gpL-like